MAKHYFQLETYFFFFTAGGVFSSLIIIIYIYIFFSMGGIIQLGYFICSGLGGVFFIFILILGYGISLTWRLFFFFVIPTTFTTFNFLLFFFPPPPFFFSLSISLFRDRSLSVNIADMKHVSSIFSWSRLALVEQFFPPFPPRMGGGEQEREGEREREKIKNKK